MTVTFDPLREAEELREQLGSDRRRLLVFFGAGSSQAVGIDGIAQLSANVGKDLTSDLRAHYERLIKAGGQTANVETVLDRIRLCREMIGTDMNAVADGLKGNQAEILDRAICRAIYARVKIDPPKGYLVHAEFAAWLNSIQRSKPVEIFSTNYDLIIERGLEIAGVPFFDGFVGSVQPHFSDAASDLAETGAAHSSIPRSWVRVWKLHGSIGWRSATEPLTGAKRTVRLSLVDPSDQDDVMIFPSREKYSDSRRLPFIALHDRLRRLTASGECLILVIGYSFSDQHINDTLFSNLRANNRLSMTALMFDPLANDTIVKNLIKPAQGIRNLTAYGPDQALIGGVQAKWSSPQKPPANIESWPFWDDDKSRFTLGDFSVLPKFLKEFIGARPLLTPQVAEESK